MQVPDRIDELDAPAVACALLQAFSRVVQELVEELLRKGLDKVSIVLGHVREFLPEAVQLTAAHVVPAPSEATNHGDYAPGSVPMEKVLGVFLDDGLGLGNGALALEQVVVQNLMEVVHIVQKYVRFAADLGLHITRNRQVENE